MNLRDYLRTRRQRKARKRYEQDKARQAAANDPTTMERVVEAGKWMGGTGSSSGTS
jgi:hypothetical protein